MGHSSFAHYGDLQRTAPAHARAAQPTPMGELQQRQYTFAGLTGNAAGKGEVQSSAEEDFYGAGPWKG